MIIEFCVENFRSIKEEVSLNFLSSKSDKKLEENVIKNVTKKHDLLGSMGIFGANASGKSNVLLGLNALKRLVCDSHTFQKDSSIGISTFKFDDTCENKPANFKIRFIKNGIIYYYKLSVNKERVVDECLYSFPNMRKVIIFERKNTSDYTFVRDKRKFELIKEQTLPNVLFLSRAAQLNNADVFDAFDWFNKDLIFIKPDSIMLNISRTQQLLKSEENKKRILQALDYADFGITDISSKTQNNIYCKDNTRDISKKGWIILEDSINPTGKILLKHGDNYLELEEESEGTRKFLSMLGPILDAVDNGKVLILDEIDTILHHLLVEYILKMFHLFNKNRAQLLFSSHNIGLLDLKLLRRDQIWFTEKNPESHATELFSLLEFKPRNDKDIKTAYILGRYGALPFIKSESLV